MALSASGVQKMFYDKYGRYPSPQEMYYIKPSTNGSYSEALTASWLNQIGAISGVKPVSSTTTKTPTTTKTSTTTAPKTTTSTSNLDSMKLAESIVKNPSTALAPATTLADDVKPVSGTEAGTNIDPNASKYQMDADALEQNAQTVDTVAGATTPDERTAQGYEAQTTADQVAAQDMTAAQGQVSNQSLVDPNTGQVDIESVASGYNPDGTLNATGQALNDFAEMDLDNVDARATTKGQLEILQADFTGPNGEPKIPIYAQGAARAVSRIAAFRGMTGTAATAAMATAMMEASIQVADSDAKFYQTLTIKNLDNKQAQILQKAGVLAQFELQNADNRMAAAIQNSQAFLAMDLKNLDNEQQARVINTQNRVQSILEDAKAVNTQRLFTAQSTNEMGMFYDQLSSAISQFNASQLNGMAQFNTGEVNSMAKFNSELENQREQFYKQMQYAIDTANAKWRQDVTLHNSNQQFNAAALDVKNAVDITTEALNQLWDRSDAMLDYIWKSSESEKDRKTQLALGNLEANTKLQIGQMEQDAADSAGLGSIFGSIAGNIAGSDKFLDFLF